MRVESQHINHVVRKNYRLLKCRVRGIDECGQILTI